MAEDRSRLIHAVGKNVLVVVDYTSYYPEEAKLEDLSSINTISNMKSVMVRHCLPSVVVSDIGPQVSSREFRQFAKQYGLKHVTSGVMENDEDPYLALLNYRASPLSEVTDLQERCQ